MNTLILLSSNKYFLLPYFFDFFTVCAILQRIYCKYAMITWKTIVFSFLATFSHYKSYWCINCLSVSFEDHLAHCVRTFGERILCASRLQFTNRNLITAKSRNGFLTHTHMHSVYRVLATCAMFSTHYLRVHSRKPLTFTLSLLTQWPRGGGKETRIPWQKKKEGSSDFWQFFGRLNKNNGHLCVSQCKLRTVTWASVILLSDFSWWLREGEVFTFWMQKICLFFLDRNFSVKKQFVKVLTFVHAR